MVNDVARNGIMRKKGRGGEFMKSKNEPMVIDIDAVKSRMLVFHGVRPH